MLKRRSSYSIPQDIQNKLDMFFEDLNAIGVAYIGHGIINNLGDHTGYFSHKPWGKRYIQNNYFFTEPILENYKDNGMSIIPWQRVGEASAIVQARNDCMNIVSGITICKKESEFNTFFNIGITKERDII